METYLCFQIVIFCCTFWLSKTPLFLVLLLFLLFLLSFVFRSFWSPLFFFFHLLSFFVTLFIPFFHSFCVYVQKPQKTRDSFENMGECQQGDLEKLDFLFCPSFTVKKRMFFKTKKSENYIFSNVQKNQKMNVEGTIFEIFPLTERTFRKTILEMLEENFLMRNFFSKEQDWKMQQRKKMKPKRRRKTEGVSQKEMKRGSDKGNWKETQGFAKMKGRKKFFFWKRKCLATKKGRVTMRRVDKERGNIRRVHTKEWKHEKSQQIEKETTNIRIRMNTIKMEIWTGRFFC